MSRASGWIKLEKKLREDIRVKRMAKALPSILPAICNGIALHTETLCRTVVLGCLCTVWCHADTFARPDDSLDLTAEEIDDLVGIPSFHTILPADWFEMLADGRVKLPGYQAHNGPEAKEKLQTADRVHRHRDKKRNGNALHDDEGSNGTPLLDKTRQDQTRPDKTHGERAIAVPRETNPEVTKAGAVCVAMKAEGMIDVTPSHPLLLELLNAGAEIGEFADAAKRAVSEGKRFTYALAIVRGQREDAARLAGGARSASQANGRRHVAAPTVEQMEADMKAGLRDSNGTWIGPARGIA